jgi:endonuclease YncB( thermonuclease family)
MPGLLAAFWLVVGAGAARAESYTGRAVGVVTGDTLDVRDPGGHVRRVRLAGIRAPVKGQPFFNGARNSLIRLVGRKKIWVDWYHSAGNCRRPAVPSACLLVGKVFLAGVDIGLHQLERGLAWHDVGEMGDQSITDRGLYSETEEQARIEHRGLWGTAHPVEPWLWARSHRRDSQLARRPRRIR